MHDQTNWTAAVGAIPHNGNPQGSPCRTKKRNWSLAVPRVRRAARNESSPGPDFRRSRAYRSCFASADRAWGIESSAVRNLSSDGRDILSFLVYGRIFLGIRADALCPWYV